MIDLKNRTLLSHVKEVRVLLNDTGCVEFSPFMSAKCDKELAKRFSLFAMDIESAAVKLSDIADVKCSIGQVGEGSVLRKVHEYMEQKRGEGQLLFLDQEFKKALAKPFFALCSLEKSVEQGRNVHPLTARKTLDELKELYLVVRAIPTVCELTPELNR